MKKKIQKKAKGFTLIELLVVMTIIVVLASIGMVSYRSASQGARDSKRKSDMETFRQALVLYKQEHTNYPNGNLTSMKNTITSYLSKPQPADPNNSTGYTYNRPTTQTFCVCALLEKSGKGNSNSVCNFSAGTKNYYCAVQP